MFGSLGHAPVNAVEFLTSTTLPEPAAIAIVPVASGAGSNDAIAAARTFLDRDNTVRAASVIDVSGVTDHVDAVALAYCTDQPLRLTGEFPALKISMKSFRNGAPELPPPPKIWLITMCWR